MPHTSVSIKLTPDGYTVTCPGTPITGHGPTETAAWSDFWAAYHAQWKPPAPLTPSGGSLNAPQGRRRTRTVRLRDLFG
ncbi:hypothetical protein [Streptomyces sp. NPDC048266]|uniref:hypothetical protein n=1 Tax=Streptomyces sp. NPDC048266 TaxID=3155787 RepID=UPI0033D817A2